MRKLFWTLMVSVWVSIGAGCASTPWADLGLGNGDDAVSAPPFRLERSAGRATGVSDEARAIESRLNYH